MNKFIYFYSPLYNFYKNHINNTLGSFFDVEGIEINDLNNDKGGHTFFNGVSVKIELIISKIKENLNNFIIFSDATIFINKNNVSTLSDFFDIYKVNDLCFLPERENYYNIGIILIKCNDKTLSFFNNVLDDLRMNKGWDQDVINKHLQYNNNLIVNNFDSSKILIGWEFNNTYRDTYLIYKSFIHHNSDIIKNYNTRLDIFRNGGLISDIEYNDNKK